jgi:hypothetical protein
MNEATGVAVHDPEAGHCRLPVAQTVPPFTVPSWLVKNSVACLLAGALLCNAAIFSNARHCGADQVSGPDAWAGPASSTELQVFGVSA